MAAITLIAIGAQMPIILAVTGDALGRCLGGPWRLMVTVGALQSGMRTEQRKFGFLGVIEAPDRPSIGRVAALALLAEAAMMHVLVSVTADAGRRRIPEGQRRVTLRAAHDPVQPEQWITRQIVIEKDVAAPALLAVAAVTAPLEPAAVRIFRAMTVVTSLAQFLLRNDRCVASVAGDPGVGSLQREVMTLQVIVIDRVPMLVVVAIPALAAIAARVSIIGVMAAPAVLGDLVLVVAAAVTGQTVDPVVHTEQRVAGFLLVIVFRGLPLAGGVAAATVRAPRAAVLIVRGVAAVAARGCRLVVSAHVAGVAARIDVRSRQFEIGLLVIELAARPAAR